MTDNTAATRAARYRKRQRLTDAAELNGADILDAALVARMPDGHYVVAPYSGKSVHLVPRDDAANVDAKLDRVIELLSEKAPARVEREPEPVLDTAKPPRKKSVRIPQALTTHDDPKVKMPPAGSIWQVSREAMSNDKARDVPVERIVGKIAPYVNDYLKIESFDTNKFAAQLTAMINALRELHGDDWAGHIPTWKVRE